ncbi:phytanoyl-CoA dioxygenase family protein [Thermaurantiacus sp.]
MTEATTIDAPAETSPDGDLFAMSEHIAGTNPYRHVRTEDLPDGSLPEMPAGPLPQPTRDPERLLADFDTFGWCLIADAIDDATREHMLERLDSQYRAEQKLGLALETPQRDARVTNLLMKGAIFQRALLNPLADQVLEHALGEDFLLSVIGSVRTGPGSLAQGLHIDQAYVGFPTPVAMVCNTVTMLEDFTEEVGATRIVPGSHRWPPRKVKELNEGIGLAGGTGLENPPHTVAAEAPAGSCMVFDGRLLHGTGRNKSADKTRAGIFAYYCRPFLRQFENPHLSIDEATLASLPSPIRMRLGWRPWMLLGGSQAPGMPLPPDRLRPDRFVGELHADAEAEPA